MTDWIVRLYFFIPASEKTTTLRDAVANAYVDNSSRETLASEKKFANTLVRLSTNGDDPVQVYALNSAVKPAMRDAILVIIQSVNNNAWYIVSNTDGVRVGEATYNEGELIAQGGQATATERIGTTFTFADALADMGLQVIETEV